MKKNNSTITHGKRKDDDKYIDEAQFANSIIDEIDPNNKTQTEQLRYLNKVKNAIGSQLSDSELGFTILLNNTAGTLHDEVLLTREWVSGYCLGASSINLSDKVNGDEQSIEFLDDLQQIIAMPLPTDEALENASDYDDYSDNYDESDDIYDNDLGDDTRTDIMEIQEYCKAGAISVFLASYKD